MKILNKIISLIIRACIVLILTAPAAGRLIQFAYAERGYNAVGGEWLAILLIAGGLWMLTGYISRLGNSDFEAQKERIQKSAQTQDASDFETKEL